MGVYVVTNPEDGWDCVEIVIKAETKEEAKAKYVAYFDMDISDLDVEIFHYTHII